MERSLRALVRSNHVAVVDVEVAELQVMVNWRNCRRIASRKIVEAICDIPHQWTIFISAMCIDQAGMRYIKSLEVVPQGNYLAAHLAGVIEAQFQALKQDCNPQHLIGSAWIAIPNQVELEEEQASRIFDAVGAWPVKGAT